MSGSLARYVLPWLLLASLLALPVTLGAQQSALGNAIYEKDLAEVRRLVAAGADVNAVIPGYGSTPLAQAIHQEAVEIVRFLVSEGAEVDQATRGGRTLLMDVVRSGPAEIALALLEGGADPNRVDRDGRTPLQLALPRGDPSLVRALVERGANPDRPGAMGATPLMEAVRGGDASLVRVLLELGADPDTRDMLGGTPLHAAAIAGRADLVDVLLDAGADAAVRDHQGLTALDLAATLGHGEIAANIQAAGSAPGGDEAPTRDETGEAIYAAMQELARLQEEERERQRPESHVLGPADAGRTLPEGYFSGPCAWDIRVAPAEVGARGHLRITYTAFYPGPVDEEAFSESLMGMLLTPSEEEFTAMDVVTMLSWGGDDTVSPPFCEPLRLRGPEDFTMAVHRIDFAWVVECAHEERQPGQCSRHETRHERRELDREYTPFSVSPDAAPEGDDSCLATPTVEILAPAEGEDFAFDAGDPGRLEIELRARVRPEGCEGAEIEWEADAIEGSEQEFLSGPGTGGNTGPAVTLVYTGLPADNGEFGPATIRARAAGAAAEVSVDVFFAPRATNHPGEGEDAGTPNWYYYWRQTGAMVDDTRGLLRYRPVVWSSNEPRRRVQGQYRPESDRILVTDHLVEAPCRARVDRARQATGEQAEGIDCFAEVVRHERQHRAEEIQWWRSGASGWPVAGEAVRLTRALLDDDDFDSVPNEVEEALYERGCLVDNAKSCWDRPFDDAIDREMYAYWVGWEWPIGSADHEDWSCGGKQWRGRGNASAPCPQ